MDTPDLMKAIAARIALVPGVEGASYPSLNHVEKSPWVMVIDGSAQGLSTAEPAGGVREVVVAMITIRILVKSQMDRPREATKIDALTTAIRDALNPIPYGGRVSRILPGLPGKVDRMWSRVLITRGQTTEYGGDFCYAADMTIDPSFHRTVTPLEGTP
jgi:hypothetical protein